MMSEFFGVSRRLLEQRPDLFLKMEPHDPAEPESADLLWTAVSGDPTDSCEGEVILVSHYGEQWFAEHDHADKFGGWPTVWGASGAEEEVARAVLEYLVDECQGS